MNGSEEYTTCCKAVYSLQHIREDSYISSSPSVLAMAGLDMDQVAVLSTWVVVLQQSYLPLRVKHKHYGA